MPSCSKDINMNSKLWESSGVLFIFNQKQNITHWGPACFLFQILACSEFLHYFRLEFYCLGRQGVAPRKLNLHLKNFSMKHFFCQEGSSLVILCSLLWRGKYLSSHTCASCRHYECIWSQFPCRKIAPGLT